MPTKHSNATLLNNINVSFRPFVEELWKDLTFGFCRLKVEVEKLLCSGSISNLADQFTLVLPYAGTQLKWEILFDGARPWLAPDFRFDDESFLSNVDAEYIERHLPSLAKWDDADPKSLSHVVTEMMNLYREHQKSLLSDDKDSRAYFEYTTLIGGSETPMNDIEILVGQGDSVSFMIKLNINDDQLPSLFSTSCDENPGGECAVLFVRYPNPAKVELIMSPLVTRAVVDLSLPPIQETALLMDYVQEVTDIINQRIKRVFFNEKLRYEVLSHFIVKYESSVLEHDSNTASFLLNVDDFYCILNIEIGVKFPENPPTFTLRSIYHHDRGKPRTKVLSECPYNEIEEYVMHEISVFRKDCESDE